jgi:hypothetical protein
VFCFADGAKKYTVGALRIFFCAGYLITGTKNQIFCILVAVKKISSLNITTRPAAKKNVLFVRVPGKNGVKALKNGLTGTTSVWLCKEGLSSLKTTSSVTREARKR